jgi:hypothetical protein
MPPAYLRVIGLRQRVCDQVLPGDACFTCFTSFQASEKTFSEQLIAYRRGAVLQRQTFAIYRTRVPRTAKKAFLF